MCPRRLETAYPDHPASDRTAEIQAAAAALFLERGYSATTVTHIADAVGVFPGSLYNHFDSKEDIAVEILEQFDRELNTLGATLSVRSTDATAEEWIEHLARQVMEISLRSGAAVRLRAYEPPTVAGGRLRAARVLRTPALDTAWARAVDDLVDGDPTRAEFAPLLRYALRSLAYEVALQFPLDSDPAVRAHDVTSILLRGLAREAPSDSELDRSEALQAAMDAIGSWPPRVSLSPENDIRDQIIAAARQEFAKHGYDATTIRDVADAADVGMGTLYRRVGSKEAMLAEVVSGFAPHFDAAIRAALETGASEVESIDALARVFVAARRRFRDESDILLFSWRAMAAETGPLHDYVVTSQKRLAILESLVRRGVQRGTLRRVDAAEAVAPYIRFIVWTPYQDVARTSEERSHRFLRRTLLCGFLN